MTKQERTKQAYDAYWAMVKPAMATRHEVLTACSKIEIEAQEVLDQALADIEKGEQDND